MMVTSTQIDGAAPTADNAMHTLYIIPGSCSMGPHILLRELGLEHRVEVVDFATGKEAFEAVNPRGKVPALVTPEGALVTEQLGIDSYLAALATEDTLIPADPLTRGRVYEALGFANSTAHPPVGHMYFPGRFVDGDAEQKRFVEGARTRFEAALGKLEALIEGPYLLGETFCAADAYLFVMYWWALRGKLDLGRTPKLNALGQAMRERASVRGMMEAEGLT